jgi:sporulation protein YlmC with PRC-barrel domain
LIEEYTLESEKPLTRDALVSMQVIDSRGRLIGKVKDVAFSVGQMGVSLVVESDAGEMKTIGWEEVQAAADFIILKPPQVAKSSYQPQPVQSPVQVQPQIVQQPSQPMCPTCGKPLTWIVQYKRWYCYTDKKYV